MYRLAERAQSNREGPRHATADAGRDAHRPGCRTGTCPMPEGAGWPHVAGRNATTAAAPPEPGAVQVNPSPLSVIARRCSAPARFGEVPFSMP